MLYNVEVKCQKPFFVAFIGRSGSTHLMHLLNQHPAIRCFNESFTPHSLSGPKGNQPIKRLKRAIKQIMGRDRLCAYKLHQIYGKKTPQARGFEFKFSKQFESFPEIHEWLKSHKDQMKCIFLYRKNNLRAALSLQNFKHLKKQHKTANLSEKSDVQLKRLDVDIDCAIEETRKREMLNKKYYKDLSKDFDILKISYEDLIDTELKTLNSCFDFLGIETISDSKFFKHKTKRISSENIEDYVANFNELETRLKDENLDHYIQTDKAA